MLRIFSETFMRIVHEMFDRIQKILVKLPAFPFDTFYLDTLVGGHMCENQIVYHWNLFV